MPIRGPHVGRGDALTPDVARAQYTEQTGRDADHDTRLGLYVALWVDAVYRVTRARAHRAAMFKGERGPAPIEPRPPWLEAAPAELHAAIREAFWEMNDADSRDDVRELERWVELSDQSRPAPKPPSEDALELVERIAAEPPTRSKRLARELVERAAGNGDAGAALIALVDREYAVRKKSSSGESAVRFHVRAFYVGCFTSIRRASGAEPTPALMMLLAAAIGVDEAPPDDPNVARRPKGRARLLDVWEKRTSQWARDARTFADAFDRQFVPPEGRPKRRRRQRDVDSRS